MKMATDYAVPCIRRATAADGLTLPQRAVLDGFSDVRVIGAEGEVTAVVPFLVDESITSSPDFWKTPPGTIRASAQLDRPIPSFGYKTKTTKKKTKKRKPTQEEKKAEENENEQEQDPDQMPPDSPAWQADTPDWQSQSQDWQADLDSKHDARCEPDIVQDPHSSLPKDWGARMTDASIGKLAVTQVVYGELSDNEIGVSVVEVPLIY